MPARVLLVDDDARLHELLKSYLEDNGFVVASARDGREGLDRLAREPFDAVLLDVMMPGMDGLEVCRRIRDKSQIPIVMLTAKGDETDRVVGLELGADDYLAKPFGPRELLARLRAVLRRSAPADASRTLRAGDLEIELSARRVTLAGREIDLTAIEFDLLVALAERPNRVVSRDVLLELAGRSDTHVSDRTVDVHVSHLRQKIGDDARTPKRIKTVRGVGYVLTGGA